ncbi:MAG: phage tail protein, partial [Methylobacteriaceae bacterium]|nr:phage tail protein [Methylobacteriaceae bacterium]
LLARSRAQETELPASLRLSFTDSEGDYARAAVSSHRLAGASRQEESVSLAAVLRRDEAARLADLALQDAWAGREEASFALSPRRVELAVGDVVALATGAAPQLHRVVRVQDGAVRRVTTRSVEPAVFTRSAAASAPVRSRPAPAIAGPPAVALLPVATDPDEVLLQAAVAAEPWPGAVAIWRAPDGADLALAAVADRPAILGRTLGPLGPGPVWRWDRRSVLEVELSGAGLTSLDDLAALGDGNLLALEGEGGFEVLIAARAELIGPRRYRLARFLRGLGASEALASRTVPPGATLVRLDGALVPLATAPADLGRTWRYRIGPADRDPADPSFVERVATATGDAIRPLAPVRLKARREPAGVRLTWIRQTRRDGDSWDVAEVPLGEESERYELDILRDGRPCRTLPSAGPSALYAAADELADWGAPQSALAVSVVQLGTFVGRGAARCATLPVI